jgi:HEAT repeat protein
MSEEVDGAAAGQRNLADRTARRRRAALAGHRSDPTTARALLDDVDGVVRATALGALARCGAVTADDVRAALADPDPTVRIRAATVAAAGATDVSLLGLLDDPDPTVVEAAAWACGEREPAEPGAVTRLAALTTSHDDPLVREAAVAALGAIGDPAGLAAVLAATGDRATVRRRAVLALAPFDGPDVDAALERARTDRDWQVRQAAEDLA